MSAVVPQRAAPATTKVGLLTVGSFPRPLFRGQLAVTGRLSPGFSQRNEDTQSMSEDKPRTHADYRLSQLDQLEAESIHIAREVAA